MVATKPNVYYESFSIFIMTELLMYFNKLGAHGERL